LKAITDRLREEVNPLGVRVLTVYFGPHSHADAGTVCREEGRVYDPEALLQPEDAATVVLQALVLPAKAEVTDVAIRPMAKACGPLKVGSMTPRSIMKARIGFRRPGREQTDTWKAATEQVFPGCND